MVRNGIVYIVMSICYVKCIYVIGEYMPCALFAINLCVPWFENESNEITKNEKISVYRDCMRYGIWVCKWIVTT